MKKKSKQDDNKLIRSVEQDYVPAYYRQGSQPMALSEAVSQWTSPALFFYIPVLLEAYHVLFQEQDQIDFVDEPVYHTDDEEQKDIDAMAADNDEKVKYPTLDRSRKSQPFTQEKATTTELQPLTQTKSRNSIKRTASKGNNLMPSNSEDGCQVMATDGALADEIGYSFFQVPMLPYQFGMAYYSHVHEVPFHTETIGTFAKNRQGEVAVHDGFFWCVKNGKRPYALSPVLAVEGIQRKMPTPRHMPLEDYITRELITTLMGWASGSHIELAAFRQEAWLYLDPTYRAKNRGAFFILDYAIENHARLHRLYQQESADLTVFLI